MKVTIEKPENEKQEIEFPCLMECVNEVESYIVYFSDRHTGMQLTESHFGSPGFYSESWDPKMFSPLPKGSKVIIEQ